MTQKYVVCTSPSNERNKIWVFIFHPSVRTMPSSTDLLGPARRCWAFSPGPYTTYTNTRLWLEAHSPNRWPISCSPRSRTAEGDLKCSWVEAQSSLTKVDSVLESKSSECCSQFEDHQGDLLGFLFLAVGTGSQSNITGIKLGSRRRRCGQPWWPEGLCDLLIQFWYNWWKNVWPSCCKAPGSWWHGRCQSRSFPLHSTASWKTKHKCAKKVSQTWSYWWKQDFFLLPL